MRQAEWPEYSSAETFSSLPFPFFSFFFLFSPFFPLFLSRKPTASPYKLPFVPLISPWPLVRTYLIRINARAAWKLASCSAPLLLSLSFSLSSSLSFDVVPLPCLAPLALLPLTSLPEITWPRKVRKPESVRASSTANEALEEWAGVVKTWIPYLTGSRTGERTFASPSALSFWVKEWLGLRRHR